MEYVALIILMIIILVVLLVILPRVRTRRAIRSVVQAFRQHDAVRIKNAKTADKLGLRTQPMSESIFRGTDYQLHALEELISCNVIRTTEDGRLYLSEENLSCSEFGKYERGN